MRLTILGGGGGWPTARQPCAGYLVEHAGRTLLIDPGYAVLPQLQALRGLASVDAVLVSHGHLDHCADLPALLAGRVGDGLADPLPVYAPDRAVDDLLRASRSLAVRRSVERVTLRDGDTFALGGLAVQVALLPHHLPSAGVRLSGGGRVLAVTGDSGVCPERVALAAGADVLLAEATYTDRVPPAEVGLLSTAREAGELAIAAGVGHTVLVHHRPGEPVAPWLSAARATGVCSLLAASPGMSVDLEPGRSARPRRASDAPPRGLTVLPRRAG